MILPIALLLSSVAGTAGTLPSGQTSQLTDLHPKHSQLYIEVPQIQALGAVLEELPLMRLFHDPEVQAAVAALGGPEDGFDLFEFLSKPTGMAEFDRGLSFLRRLESVSISMERIEQKPSGLIVAELSNGVTEEDWKAAFAMLDVDMEQVVVDGTSGEDMPADSGRYAFLFGPKQTYWTLSSELVPDFRAWMQASDDCVVLGFGETARASLKNFDVSKSMTGSRESLRMVATKDEVKGQAIMSATGQLDLKGMLGASAPDRAEGEQDRASKTAVSPGAFSYSLKFDGEQYQSAARVALPQLPLLDRDSAAKLVPADSIGALAANFDFAYVIQNLKQAMEANGRANSDSNAFQKQIENLFGNLGPQIVFFMPPVSGVTLPAVQMWCDVKDVESFSKSLDAISAQMAAGNPLGLALKREEYRDAVYWVLDHGRNTGMVTFMPSFAVLDGKLYACMEPRLMKRLLRDRRKGETGGPTAPHVFLKDLDSQGLASAVFLDWGELLGGYYGVALGFSAMAGPMLGMEIDPETLPQADLFKRYLKPWSGSIRNQNGFWHYNSRSSFGPEMMLPMVVGIINEALLDTQAASAPMGR